MKMITLRSLLSLVAATLLAAPAAAAELRALVAEAFRPATEGITADFEKATGHKLVLTFGTAGVLRDKLRSGEAADAVVLPQGIFDSLRAEGRIAAGSGAPVAQSLISVAVRAGSAKPDIATPDALKKAFLAARAVAYPDPAAGGAVGVHAVRVIEKLGITESMKGRTRLTTGGGTRDLLASGEAELGVLAPAVALADSRIELVGPFPMELQDASTSLFFAAVTAHAREAEAARALLQYLASPAAARVIKAKGLEPQAKQ